MNKKIILIIFSMFIVWRIVLFLIAAASIYSIPDFGARFPYYDRVLTITHTPNWIWGFGNFDGVHYLRIAQNGYDAEYSQAFFPAYPMIIRGLANFFPKDLNLDTSLYVDPSYFWSAIILSNVLFFLGLVVFYKLLKIDFGDKVSLLSLLFLLALPTSYYFGAVYAESLFFFLCAGSIYLLRTNRNFMAAILIAVASATKVFGVLLAIVYIVELLRQGKWSRGSIIGIVLLPVGLISYSYYLKVAFDNPLYFLTSQSVFGASRSTEKIILYPQVLYRYAKMMAALPKKSLEIFTVILELVSSVLPLGFLLCYIKKIRVSYLLFTAGILILPSLTGTFSSMPRYSLFAFLLIPYFVRDYGRFYKLSFAFMVLLQIILLSMFIRGYWVA